MQPTNKTAVELVHRLLFRALIEIRAQGHEQKDKLVFHLADLFHNAVLDMEAAAEGKLNYEDVLRQLEEKGHREKLPALAALGTHANHELPAIEFRRLISPCYPLP